MQDTIQATYIGQLVLTIQRLMKLSEPETALTFALQLPQVCGMARDRTLTKKECCECPYDKFCPDGATCQKKYTSKSLLSGCQYRHWCDTWDLNVDSWLSGAPKRLHAEILYELRKRLQSLWYPDGKVIRPHIPCKAVRQLGIRVEFSTVEGHKVYLPATHGTRGTFCTIDSPKLTEALCNSALKDIERRKNSFPAILLPPSKVQRHPCVVSSSIGKLDNPL